MTQIAPPPDGHTAPERATGLTVGSGLAFYLGAVLGTGVLALPGLAARVAGPASLLVWAGMTLASVPIAWTFALLGARMPDGGGVATYVRRAFGPRASTVAGWCFYFTIPLGVPASAYFAGDYVAHFAGGGRATALLTTAVIVVTVLAANAVGLRTSTVVQLVVAAVLLVMLTAAVAVALPHIRFSRLEPFAPHGWAAVGRAVGLVVWAFAGWEAMSHLGGEFRRPARDLPRVTVAALVVVGMLYLGLALTVVLALGDGKAAGSAPLTELLAFGLGDAAAPLVTVLAVALTIGVLNAYVSGTSRLGAALARDGALPAWLGRGGDPGQAPRRSLAVAAGGCVLGFAALAIGVVPLDGLVMLTTSAIVTVYAAGTAAATRLLCRTRERAVAAIGLVLIVAVAATFRWYLLWPAGLTVAAAVWACRRGLPLAGRARGSRRARWDRVGPAFDPRGLRHRLMLRAQDRLVVSAPARRPAPDTQR